LGIAEKFIAAFEEYNNLSGRGRSTYGFNCQPLKINRFYRKPLTMHEHARAVVAGVPPAV
jgi:hypothetical protein